MQHTCLVNRFPDSAVGRDRVEPYIRFRWHSPLLSTTQEENKQVIVHQLTSFFPIRSFVPSVFLLPVSHTPFPDFLFQLTTSRPLSHISCTVGACEGRKTGETVIVCQEMLLIEERRRLRASVIWRIRGSMCRCLLSSSY